MYCLFLIGLMKQLNSQYNLWRNKVVNGEIESMTIIIEQFLCEVQAR